MFETPFFGIVLTIAAFEVGAMVYKRVKFPIMNPVIIATALIMAVLQGFDIDLETYNQGGRYISFFLGPATVVLAVPLYRQMHVLKENLVPIIGGIAVGCIVSVGSVLMLSKWAGLDAVMMYSFVPKSVTTPIGIELSSSLGGIPSLTVSSIVITGIIGAVIGPWVCRVSGIKDAIAVGVALGTSAHAIGTSKAMELGETEGALSGLAIGVAGLMTVFIVTIMVLFQ